MEQIYKIEDVVKEEQKGFKNFKFTNVTLNEILNSIKDVLQSFPEYKKRNVVKYQIYCYLANQYTYKSKLEIARKGGYVGVDFLASVVVAINKYEKNYKKDKVFRTIVNACRGRIEDINSSIENQREELLKTLDFKLETLTVEQLKIASNYLNRF